VAGSREPDSLAEVGACSGPDAAVRAVVDHAAPAAHSSVAAHAVAAELVVSAAAERGGVQPVSHVVFALGAGVSQVAEPSAVAVALAEHVSAARVEVAARAVVAWLARVGVAEHAAVVAWLARVAVVEVWPAHVAARHGFAFRLFPHVAHKRAQFLRTAQVLRYL